MIQFYFLSVFFNLVGGYALFAADGPSRVSSLEGLRGSLRNPTSRLILGILSLVTGAFKLLTVVRGDIPIVGDFLPAAAGLAVGLTLLVELYRDPASPFRNPPAFEGQESEENRTPLEGFKATRLETYLHDNRGSVGLAGMIASLVHFLFPMVLFL